MVGHRNILVSSLFVCAIACFGCGRQDSTSPPASPVAMPEARTVTIFAAASTQDAVNEAAAAFKSDAGTEVKISPAGSNTLANQIVNGAPADVFLSADEQWGEFVQEKGFAVESHPLLGNRLVLIVPKGNPAGVKSPSDLTDAKVEHVALAGENVPAGIYAKQSLDFFHVYDALARDKKIVRGKDVRATLNLVDLGEVSAGVVYGTDAASSKRVEVVYTFDGKTHDPILYPLLLLKHGQDNPAARKFFDFLRSDSAGKIFKKYGFELLK